MVPAQQLTLRGFSCGEEFDAFSARRNALIETTIKIIAAVQANVADSSSWNLHFLCCKCA
jgi:hypothetical protein